VITRCAGPTGRAADPGLTAINRRSGARPHQGRDSRRRSRCKAGPQRLEEPARACRRLGSGRGKRATPVLICHHLGDARAHDRQGRTGDRKPGWSAATSKTLSGRRAPLQSQARFKSPALLKAGHIAAAVQIGRARRSRHSEAQVSPRLHGAQGGHGPARWFAARFPLSPGRNRRPSAIDCRPDPDCPGARAPHPLDCRGQTAGPSRRLSQIGQTAHGPTGVAAADAQRGGRRKASLQADSSAVSNQDGSSPRSAGQGVNRRRGAAVPADRKNPFELGSHQPPATASG